jgi:Heterokaryon incompatibility protein (HET)
MGQLGSVIDDIRFGAGQDPLDPNGSTPLNPSDDRLYNPLNEDEIRILEVLPGREEDMIQSRLECIKLGNLTSNYNALSYVWGDPKKPKAPLVVNGHILQVTENCISALTELRREFMAQSKTCFVWIDAICINQMDTSERNQQVLAMTRIYRSSRKLIVWLGLESDGSHEAIEIMKALPDDCDQQGSGRWCESCEINRGNLQRWLCICKFFSRCWFSRVWIIQEYLACTQTRISTISEVASTDIEFYCGTSRVSPALLAKTLRHGGYLDTTTDGPNGDIELQKQVNSVFTLFRRGWMCFADILERASTPLSFSSSEETAHHFLRCIVRGMEYGATEPRDRVYAHLPLQLTWQGNVEILIQEVCLDLLRQLANGEPITCSPIEVLGQSFRQNDLNFSKLIIDYSRSVEDIYSSLVCFMVFATKNLNILSLCYSEAVM